jgi:hypothetical protein
MSMAGLVANAATSDHTGHRHVDADEHYGQAA